jgi:hypothetical protein
MIRLAMRQVETLLYLHRDRPGQLLCVIGQHWLWKKVGQGEPTAKITVVGIYWL